MPKSPEEIKDTPYTEENVGSKEAQKLPLVLFVYRDNDLFKGLLPKVTNELKSLGREIEVKSFLPETKEDDIKKWFEKNLDEVLEKELVTDMTCDRAEVDVSHLMYEKLGREKFNEWQRRMKLGYLDFFSEEITRAALLGKDYKRILNEWSEKDYESALLSLKVNLAFILKRIFEDKKNMPKNVYILIEHLFDHTPFKLKKFEADKKGEYIDEEREAKEAAGQLKNFLIDNGLKKNAIFIKDLLISENRDAIDKKGNWVILDRHYREELVNAIALRMPFPNFYKDTVSKKLISAQPEELERAFKEVLKEDFGSKMRD